MDLTAIANNKLSSIEIIDLNNTGSTLTLGDDDVLTMVGTEAANVLRINGSSSDTVNINNTGFSASGGTTTIDSVTYNIYINAGLDSSVQLLIEQGMDVILPPVELSDVEVGIGGFAIHGVSAYDFSGISVSGAGDVNGDGLSDLIIGASHDDPNGYESGASFVVFGKTEGIVIELSDIEAGTGGFVINGVSADDNSGWSVSGAGDINGDALDDLIVTAPWDDPNGNISGASFVVFGKTDGTAMELSDIETGTGGFVINGVGISDFSGFSVSGAGDVNGDGLDDVFVGAVGSPGGFAKGASFVVFGKTDGTVVELSDVEVGSGGFVINGVSEGDQSGYSVSGAGDVNGDGLDDVIVGAPLGGTVGNGASFVVFGKTDGFAVELSDIVAGTGGFVINGASDGDLNGRSVSGAGDINGDGLDDLIIGALTDVPNGNNSGASFVVFGKTDVFAVELSDIENGVGGFVINGVSALDYSGQSVSGAGDVNGDGLDDLIIGAHGDDPNGSYSGASFVVFGKTDGLAVELSDIEEGMGGFVINGVSAYDESGFLVSGAGDVNGDGFDDLIVGAPGDDPNGDISGASFVVFGGLGTNATVGTSGNDSMVGDSSANQLVAGQGDDTLVGNGGDDLLRAAVGNDVFIGGEGQDTLDGGPGADTFRFDSINEAGDEITDFDRASGDQLLLQGGNGASDFQWGVQSDGTSKANTSDSVGSGFMLSGSNLSDLMAQVQSAASGIFTTTNGTSSKAYYFGLADEQLYYFGVSESGTNATITTTVTVAQLSDVLAVGTGLHQVSATDIILF